MSTPIIPQIECTKHHPGLQVEHVVSAVEFYTKELGFWLGFMWGDPPGDRPWGLRDCRITATSWWSGITC